MDVDVFYLDLDGVMHPEAVYWSLKRGAYLDDRLAAAGHCLFEHAPLLEVLLVPYPNVRIVLSTSWARTFGYGKTVKRLPPSLAARCIGATWHSQMDPREFDALTRGEQVRSDVGRRKPEIWLALDDVDDGWGNDRDNVVLTQPILGLASPPVLDDLKRKLTRFRMTNGSTTDGSMPRDCN